MYHDKRLLPFNIDVEDQKIVFKNAQKPKLIRSFPLKRVHLRTCDTPDEKICDPDGLNYCVMLEIAKTGNYIKLYFMSFEAMKAVIT